MFSIIPNKFEEWKKGERGKARGLFKEETYYTGGIGNRSDSSRVSRREQGEEEN